MDKKVILVADDIEMNRSVMRRFLNHDFEILEADDGKMALDILDEKRVDVLLLDIIMPEIDGLEVLKRVRADHKFDEMAILVATSTKEKTERMALQFGADDIVSKPYDPFVIKKRLENVMARKELQRKNRIFEAENGEEAVRLELYKRYGTKMEGLFDLIEHSVKTINENITNEVVIKECSDHIIDTLKETRQLIDKMK